MISSKETNFLKKSEGFLLQKLGELYVKKFGGLFIEKNRRAQCGEAQRTSSG